MTGRVYTPSVVNRIRLMAPTHTAEQIADMVGIRASGLRSFCAYAGILLKVDPPKRKFTMMLTAEAAARFRSAAYERNLDDNEFVRRLLETVAADDMIDAVMADDVFEKKTGTR